MRICQTRPLYHPLTDNEKRKILNNLNLIAESFFSGVDLKIKGMRTYGKSLSVAGQTFVDFILWQRLGIRLDEFNLPSYSDLCY